MNDGDEVETRRAALVRAYDEAVAADDVEAMSSAALALARLQVFGTIPGRLPAFLHRAYERSTGRQRVELAIAIARTWSYGGDAQRAQPFVDEAMAAREVTADPALLAAALDAQLLTKWGPDDFADRLAVTSRLEDVVAHLSDVELRMNAHLWRLTTGLECCDVPVIRRQLRSLDTLATDTGSARVRFFAASRRAMHATLVGDLELADRAHAETVAAGTEAGEPDTFAVDNALAAAIARQRGDTAALARLAPLFEEFGEREGVIAVAAEAAQNWLYAGDETRARRLLHQLAGADFGGIARGVDWMHTIARLTEVAAQLGERELVTAAQAQLIPYAGRGVVDGGAVAFVGVVDEFLAEASEALGKSEEARHWRGSAAAHYRRLGASWWLGRCETAAPATAAAQVFRPAAGDSWEFGRVGATTLLHGLRGFHYLRLLLQRPHVDIHARVLSDAAAGHPGVAADQAGLGPVLDRTAIASFRRRIAELDDDIDAARAANDGERAAVLDAERETLLTEIRTSTGLTGQSRSGGSTDERARVAVRKAIAAAIDKLRTVDPSLARVLDDTVSTGFSCRYEPDPDRPVTWQLD